ncbi:hypothetical protein BYT27DRAFT_7195169 [Phlegmacium glaucopus]|jgi:hypothetical protein|nr:hypothetical protein BYT27DRAFT_7195169 [Phlegmacium glaucopus]
MTLFQVQRWSWIFIFHALLVQPSFARLSHDILARKVVDNLFQRGLSKEEKTRNAYIAVAITAAVVLVVGLVGLFLFIRKRRQVLPEPEAGADHKPSWWMVDGKTDKKDWWRLGPQATPPTEPLGPDGRSRTQRLKAALGLRVTDQPILPTHRSTIKSPPLPMQTDPSIQPRYPASLERGDTRDQAPSLPPIPSIAINLTDQHLERKLSVPPRVLLTHSPSRSTSERRVLPRSPAAGRRRSRSLTQPIRNPFLPLRESDDPVSQFTALKADAKDSRLGRSHSISRPHETPTPHPALQPSFSGRKSPPPALQLREPETPRSGRKVQFGLPRSPRPSGIQ